MVSVPLIALITPEQMSQELANRLRELRLLENWSRKTLAQRSGVTVASLERFERTGKISLESLLKVVHALGRLQELENLFSPPAAASLDELEKQRTQVTRKRGRQ